MLTEKIILQYLYLLFDEDNPLHKDDSNHVFTTEGHLLTLRQEHLKPVPASRRKARGIDSHQCPAYQPFSQRHGHERTGLIQGVSYRSDVDYARELVGRSPSQQDIDIWSPYGWCERPKVDLFVSLNLIPLHPREIISGFSRMNSYFPREAKSFQKISVQVY